jgi:hypothetical protein
MGDEPGISARRKGLNSSAVNFKVKWEVTVSGSWFGRAGRLQETGATSDQSICAVNVGRYWHRETLSPVWRSLSRHSASKPQCER